MLAKMRTVMHNSSATLNLWSGLMIAEMRENAKALAVWALCRIKQKPFSLRIQLDLTTEQRPFFKGFLAFKAAANAATDKAPTWASCIEYIGRRLPLGARLANLVEVSRNLCRQSGRWSALWNRIYSSCALGLGY